MHFSVVIPARFASTRLPGKPLLDIAGKPMIQHVYERACESNAQRVIIATDDARIQAVAEAFGACVAMTDPAHASGTDRLQQVAQQMGFADQDIIVNVQGDEPLIPAALIDQVAHNLSQATAASIATLCEAIHGADEVFNPNVVKVVFDRDGMAHYFSRAPIPYARDDFARATSWPPSELPAGVDYFRHIGIYAYRVRLLHQFVTWPVAPLEQAESLEQLRALWHGQQIHVAQACVKPAGGVDTQADLERVRAVFGAAQTSGSHA